MSNALDERASIGSPDQSKTSTKTEQNAFGRMRRCFVSHCFSLITFSQAIPQYLSAINFALSENLKLATHVLIPHWIRVEGVVHGELLSNFNIPQAIGILGVVHKPPCIRRVGAEVLSILPPRHCLQGRTNACRRSIRFAFSRSVSSRMSLVDPSK